MIGERRARRRTTEMEMEVEERMRCRQEFFRLAHLHLRVFAGLAPPALMAEVVLLCLEWLDSIQADKGFDVLQ